MIRHDTRGITLIEVMAAFFVLTVALLGSLALTASNVRGESIGVARLLATNLGREGAEIARNIRDSNWLNGVGVGWDTGLNLGAYDISSCAIIPNSTSSSFEAVASDATCDLKFDAPTSTYQVYRNANTGVYYQKQTAAAGDVPVYGLYRRIRIKFICATPILPPPAVSSVEKDCVASDTPIGIRVTTDVSSLVQGKPYITTIEEKLYNWKL